MATRIASLSALLLLAAGLALPAANAAVPDGGSGYATGTVVHVDLLRSAASRVLDAEVATSSATTGIGGKVLNEVGQIVRPAGINAQNYGVGSALSAGLMVADDTQSQLQVAGRAEALSTVGHLLDSKRLGPVAIDPLAWASLVTADARANTRTISFGNDLSFGRSYAADVQVLNTGATGLLGSFLGPLVSLDADEPARAAVSSQSRERLVAQVDQAGHILGHNLGLMSETVQTIAPVTLFRGMPQQITIEVLGTWVLRAVATGDPGGAFVEYGPADARAQTPVIRITQLSGVQTLLSLQQLLGAKGLNLNLPGIASISIAEQPRAIGDVYGSVPDIAGDGTSAAAAVDVVRVQLLPILGGADVRVGHMEARSAVPSGGIVADLPVTKVADPTEVLVGKTFKTDIGIHNIFDCDLTVVDANDVIDSTKHAAYDVTGVTDNGTYAGTQAAGKVTWSSLGKILKGATLPESVSFKATDGPGTITDTVHVTGVCPTADASGAVKVNVNVIGSSTVTEIVKKVVVEGKQIHNPGPLGGVTGIPDHLYFLLGLMLLGTAAGAGKLLLKR